MGPVTFAHVAIRVLSIYFIAKGISHLPTVYPAVAYHDARAELDAYTILPIIAYIGGPTIAGVSLWFATPVIARYMAPPGGTDGGAFGITARHIQTVAISTAGLLIAVLTLPELVGLTIETLSNPQGENQPDRFSAGRLSVIASETLKFLFGLTLMLGVRYWTDLLQRFRTFGLKNKPVE